MADDTKIEFITYKKVLMVVVPALLALVVWIAKTYISGVENRIGDLQKKVEVMQIYLVKTKSELSSLKSSSRRQSKRYRSLVRYLNSNDYGIMRRVRIMAFPPKKKALPLQPN